MSKFKIQTVPFEELIKTPCPTCGAKKPRVERWQSYRIFNNKGEKVWTTNDRYQPKGLLRAVEWCIQNGATNIRIVDLQSEDPKPGIEK